MPSSRLCSAIVGQIVTQGASSQWLQRRIAAWRSVSGNCPVSIHFTQVRKDPSATSFSALQPTVQAWQPMQDSCSRTNPQRIRADGNRRAGYTLHASRRAGRERYVRTQSAQ